VELDFVREACVMVQRVELNCTKEAYVGVNEWNWIVLERPVCGYNEWNWIVLERPMTTVSGKMVEESVDLDCVGKGVPGWCHQWWKRRIVNTCPMVSCTGW
jgi:hypothetical protein